MGGAGTVWLNGIGQKLAIAGVLQPTEKQSSVWNLDSGATANWNEAEQRWDLAFSGGTGSALASVRVAVTTHVANLAAFSVVQDGVTLLEGDAVLLAESPAHAQNGPYVLGTVSGGLAPLTRRSDFDASVEAVPGSNITVREGTSGKGVWFLQTGLPITLGTTPLLFIQSSGATAADTTVLVSSGAVRRNALSGVVAAALGSNVLAFDTSAVDTSIGLVNGKLQSTYSIVLTDYPYNAKASTTTGSATGTAGSPNVTLAAAGDWANRDGIFLAEAGAATTLITPAAPTASVRGTTGATSRTYKIAGMTASYAITAASAGLTVANTNATLTETEYLEISPPVTPMVDGYVRANVANLAAFTVAQTNHTYIAGETVWLTAQTTAGQNGPYTLGAVVAGVAALTRATWCDSAAEATALSGYFVPVRPSKAFGGGIAGTPRMLQVTSGAIAVLGTNPITTSEEVEMILVYVNDSRTGSTDKLLGGMATRTDWFSGAVQPHFHFYDIGQASSTPDTFIPTAAQGTAVKGALIARIISGAGTTAITLDRNLVSAVTGKQARHDNVLALQDAIDSFSAQGVGLGGEILIPKNTVAYRFHQAIEIDKQVWIHGQGKNNTQLEWSTGIGMYRARPQSLSRYGSDAAGWHIEKLWCKQSNTVLPAGGDYVSIPYDGGGAGGTYDSTSHLYTGGTYTDQRKLSWLQGAGILAHVEGTIENCRVSLIRGHALVFSGTSDDTSANVNDSNIIGFTASSITNGCGVHLTGYDASNGRFSNILISGATGHAGIWDNSFTGCTWFKPHTQSCYMAFLVTGSASVTDLYGAYFEGGMLPGRTNGTTMCFGGNFGTQLVGGQIITGNKFLPGLGSDHYATPNRVYQTFGDPGAGYIEAFQTEEATFNSDPIKTGWNTSTHGLQRFIGSTSRIIDEIVGTSTKIWGGIQYVRGFLLGSSTKRRAVRGVDGIPGTANGQIYEPGDFTFDLNTGAILRAKVRCASLAAAAWVAGTGRRVGDIIRPTVNNASDRALVCSVAGTSHASVEPTWNGAADDGTIVDGTATWTVWGAAGSGVAQFHVWTGGLTEDKGADLSDTSPTITIAQGSIRELPASTLTSARSATLSTTGVIRGQTITIIRRDLSDWQYSVINGGAGAGTTIIQGSRFSATTFFFDGTDWKLRLAGSSEVRRYPTTGTNITGNATLQIGNGARYQRATGAQSANATVTIGTTGAETGDTMTIECDADTTWTLAIVNGGAGAGTLRTVPINRAEAVEATFDGTNWGSMRKVRVIS